MKFISTRGEDQAEDLLDVAWRGLAHDGGLFVPEQWPKLSSDELISLRNQPYETVVTSLFSKFGAQALGDLTALVAETYAPFRHKARAPLVQIGHDEWILELFHGPTLAFKDFAMCWLGVVLEVLLKKRDQNLVILCATSGDTGAAAVAAFARRLGIKLIVLFPEGRVSPTQQKQMTTSGADNCLPIAIDGDFDACQAMVKETFSDLDFRKKYNLTAVNSINFARILPQVVYFLTSALSLGAPDRLSDFFVPTGNFGHAYAGWIGQKMGLPIGSITVANNANNIVSRCFASGDYHVKEVSPTTSPSMDIEVASNFERLLFEVYDRDAGEIRSLMNRFRQGGGFSLPSDRLAKLQGFMAADFVTETEVAQTIRAVDKESGYVLDPHTAVGVAVARKTPSKGRPKVILSTAHPGKFSGAVDGALGRSVPLPDKLASLEGKREVYRRCAYDLSLLKPMMAEWIEDERAYND